MIQFHDDWESFRQSKLCHAWVATAIVGSAIVGGVASSFAADKASKAQVHAADKAAETSLHMYERTREDLSPFRDIGTRAGIELESRLPFFTSPIVMDQAALEKTPGYEFIQRQGLKAIQNSAAARGLGVSGAALKGAATFATDLANTTYKDQFALENTNRTNAFNRLKSLVDVGQSASAQTGSAGTTAATNAAGAQIGAGNAQAAGINAIGGAINNTANNIGGYMAYKGIYGNPNPYSAAQPGYG